MDLSSGCLDSFSWTSDYLDWVEPTWNNDVCPYGAVCPHLIDLLSEMLISNQSLFQSLDWFCELQSIV